jgi:hypothetical protein
MLKLFFLFFYFFGGLFTAGFKFLSPALRKLSAAGFCGAVYNVIFVAIK